MQHSMLDKTHGQGHFGFQTEKERKKESFCDGTQIPFSESVPHNHLSEMVADAQMVKKLPPYCGTQQFTTPFTAALY
jgi:hypothetical protein